MAHYVAFRYIKCESLVEASNQFSHFCALISFNREEKQIWSIPCEILQ